jgi:ParB/RepB/Spo0J family partition protein
MRRIWYNHYMDLALSEIVESGAALRFVNKRCLEYTQLRDSMRDDKQLVPIEVRRRADGKYEIIDGLHRYACAKDLGWKFLRAEVKEATDDEVLIQSIKMNSLGVPVSPREYACQIRTLLSRNPDWTLGRLAGVLSQPLDWVKTQLSLLRLDPKIQRDLDTGRISLQHGHILAKCPKTWQLEFREDALILSAKELDAKITPLLVQWHAGLLTGRIKKTLDFEPIAFVRPMRILKAALDKPSVADRMVVESKPETMADAFRLGVAWVLSLDPATVQARRVVAQRKHDKMLRLEERQRKERRKKAGNPEPLDLDSISNSISEEPKE